MLCLAPSHACASISGITVNEKNVTLPSSGVAAIDTGTTFIGGPAAGVSAIYAQIPDSQPLSGGPAGLYGFRMFVSPLAKSPLDIPFAFPACNATVEVTIAFGGKSWPINPKDMNRGPISSGSSICAGAIFVLDIGGGGGNPTWIVGDTFLKNVYSVFRFEPAAIGFAKLSDSAGGFL